MKNITIAGNLGRDAELRNAGSSQVLGFAVAVEHRDGQNKSTIWFDCSLWGKRGEVLAQYLTKGTKVAVAGDLATREHNGKTYLQVRADNVTILGGGGQGNQGQANRDNDQGYSNQSGYGAGGSANSGGRDLDEDVIPFRMCWEV